MKNLLIIFCLSFLCFLSSCKEEHNFKQLPAGPIKHQFIVAAKTAKSIKARGFAGATPAGAEVYFEVGPKHDKTISKADGSFDLELLDADLDARFGEFHFTL